MTVLVDMPPAVGAELFTPAGTTVPDTRGWPATLLVTVLMASCAATGTLAGGMANGMASLTSAVPQTSTLSGLPSQVPTVSDGTVVEDVLQRLRRNSRLSWGDIARAMGVSRRTIHNWLAGARIAGVHLVRLLDFDRIVSIAATSAVPEDVRARLLLPGAHGRSIIDEMALAARPARRVPLSSISVGDQLAPLSETASPRSPQRRSGLSGGSVPGRRQ